MKFRSFWTYIWFVKSYWKVAQIILKFCTEHGSITAMLWAKFQNVFTTEQWVMSEWCFTRYEFKMHFGWVFYNATAPNFPWLILGTVKPNSQLLCTEGHWPIAYCSSLTCGFPVQNLSKGTFTLTLSEHPCPSPCSSPWQNSVYTTSEAWIWGHPSSRPFFTFKAG